MPATEILRSETVNLHCPTIECNGCATSIQRSLERLPGVESVEVDVDTKNVTVQYAPAQTDAAKIAARLVAAGFPIS